MAHSLYHNMNLRKKAGKSRSKKNSTIDSKVYSKMSKKQGGFKEKEKKKSYA